MIIGVDFDNTIVSYDTLFHRVAADQGLIPVTVSVNKMAVRDWLRKQGREEDWTRLQGEVYGARMAEAEACPGAVDFFRLCLERGVSLRIVSHKTRYPFLGEKSDLHAAAEDWLECNGFFSEAGARMRREDVFFELTKPEKIARIVTCRCDWFIDDLPEIFHSPGFPTNTRFVLFDPVGAHTAWSESLRASSWDKVSQLISSRIK